MIFSTAVAAAAVLTPFVHAHGGPPVVPKIIGLESKHLTNMFSGLEARSLLAPDIHDSSVLNARASPRECGEGIGSCPKDKCCSEVGYCGTTVDYCYSPKCDYKYGPACPENISPKGTNTSSIPRPHFGSVPYGGLGVINCTKSGTVAITYDDGPQKEFTAHILDVLKSYNAKATFFVTGNNIGKGQIDITDEYVQAIKRMDSDGHQIASHTWTHLDLSKISSYERKLQMWNNEMALNNIVGKIPTYMRPPYSSCDAACQKDMSDLGYHISYFWVNTEDYSQSPAGTFQNSKDWFKGNITVGDSSPKKDEWLTIGHDIVKETAYELTEFMLSTLTQLGYKAVTMGECLGDPEENWYRKFGDAADRKGGASSSSTSSAKDTDSSQSASTSATGTGGSTPSQTQGGSASSSASSSGGPPEATGAAGSFAPRAVAALTMSAVLAVAFAL